VAEEEYLRPEDVRPEHARQVLDFLNSAQTAEQIAAAVEIPDELDVGVRLGRRILDRRGQLGTFTSLQQVADVPLIGPERFTEIVTTLSDARVPRLDDLWDEIRELREQVRSLQAALCDQPRVTPRVTPKVTVRALQEEPFLGQAVNLVVTAIEAGGKRPRVGAPLTLFTTFGRLRATDGLISQDGNAVTVRTDGNGVARALLLPPVSEDIPSVQQDTLEVTLRLLDPDAPTPRDTEDGLKEIARRYRLDGNLELRRAIDVYFRDFGRGLMETLNVRDYLLAWTYLDSTVLAYARDDSGSTAVDATAALTIRTKNWLAPWLETIEALARSESRLDQDLARAKVAGETGALLGRVYDGVNDFVSAQRGLVGGYVGQRIAESSLRDFLQSGIEDLPREKQLAIFPALDAASHTVATSDASVLGAVGETRVELRQELDTKIEGVETRNLELLDTRVGDIQTQLNSKVGTAELDDLRFELNDRIDRIPTRDLDILIRRVDDLQAKLDSKVDTTTFTEALNGKADVREIDTLRTEIETDLSRKVDTTTFDSALARKVDNSDFSDRLGALQVKVNRLEGRFPFP
jgi:polyhydroxyalkanoate synthesis regulator phasin